MHVNRITFIKRQAPLLIIAFVFLFAPRCADKTLKESQNANEVIYKLIEADNNADIQSVLNSYTDSVEFYPTGREFTKGIKNVQANYEKLFKENKLSLTTQIIETRVFEDRAIITGLNKGIIKSTTDSSTKKIDDKYIAILARDKEGDWKIDKLIWGINH